jgi:hypothetical protein
MGWKSSVLAVAFLYSAPPCRSMATTICSTLGIIFNLRPIKIHLWRTIMYLRLGFLMLVSVVKGSI